MNWLSNLFGKNAASAEPWSFPRRIEGLADTLAMTVFEHEIPRIRQLLALLDLRERRPAGPQ